MWIKLNDISIPESFKTTPPSEYKLQRARNEFKTDKNIGKKIRIDSYNNLINGYTRYLVLMENHVEKANVTQLKGYMMLEPKMSYKFASTVYVYGKHRPNGKTYVWRMTKATIDSGKLTVGSLIQVHTVNGLRDVVVEKIEQSRHPPRKMKIRKVKRCYG